MDNTIKFAGKLITNTCNRIQKLRSLETNPETDQAYADSQRILLEEGKGFCASVTADLEAEKQKLLNVNK